MSLEGTVQNGVIVLDPGSSPLADGTRVEVAVWSLVESRDLGIADETLLTDFDPPSPARNSTPRGGTRRPIRRKSPATSARTTRPGEACRPFTPMLARRASEGLTAK